MENGIYIFGICGSAANNQDCHCGFYIQKICHQKLNIEYKTNVLTERRISRRRTRAIEEKYNYDNYRDRGLKTNNFPDLNGKFLEIKINKITNV